MFFLFLFHILESVLPTFIKVKYQNMPNFWNCLAIFQVSIFSKFEQNIFWKFFKRVGNTELDLRSCSQDVHISKWRLSFLIYYKKSFCLPTYYFFCYIVFLLSKKMCMNWIPHIAMHACMRLYFGWYICIYA